MLPATDDTGRLRRLMDLRNDKLRWVPCPCSGSRNIRSRGIRTACKGPQRVVKKIAENVSNCYSIPWLVVYSSNRVGQESKAASRWSRTHVEALAMGCDKNIAGRSGDARSLNMVLIWGIGKTVTINNNIIGLKLLKNGPAQCNMPTITADIIKWWWWWWW